ncbi:MAG: 30S ribosomal protein S1, partial [Phycisphaerales bacterium]|nr:30S ribosomal protein S1 [Phycisphaerales bacterium]
MVDYNLIENLGLDDSLADTMLREAFGDQVADGDMDTLIGEDLANFSSGTILTGRAVGFAGDFVVVDVGLKSEGLVPRTEFDDNAAAIQP